jgi:predicted patatin/cPLA2 family phospholipase
MKDMQVTTIVHTSTSFAWRKGSPLVIATTSPAQYTEAGHSHFHYSLWYGAATALVFLLNKEKGFTRAVHEFPKEPDRETASAKLETMGISIDKWAEEQERYARAYAEGT